MATTIVTKSGSGAPTASDLVAGELAVDLTNKRLYTEDSGGTVLELGTNPSGNVTFGDNGKAIFGAGSDLQIYHDGVNSYIDDAGTGELLIRGSAITRIQSYLGEDMIVAVTNGATNLYYDAAKKLATTATGIDITGSVTVGDGHTIGDDSFDNLLIQSSSGEGIRLVDNHATNPSSVESDVGFVSKTLLGTNRFFIDNSTGDISFYNTAGTSQALFWDASAESLGIGTSLPAANTVHIASNTNTTGLKLENQATSGRTYQIMAHGGGSSLVGKLSIYDETAGAHRLVLDSAGSVGIGTSSPLQALHVNSGTGNSAAIFESTDLTSQIWIKDSASSSTYQTGIGCLGDNLLFNNGGEKMRIDASGNVGIGTSSVIAGGLLSLAQGSNTHSLVLDSATSAAPSLYFRTLGGTATQSNITFNDSTSLVFTTTSTERMRIDASGNVGIGTDDVTDKLTINANAGDGITFDGISASAAAEQDVSEIKFINRRSSGTTIKANIKHITNGTANGSALTFGTTTGAGATEVMRIDASGHAIIPAGVTLGTAVGVYNAANTLDDYEEGTWTVTLYDAVTGGNASPTTQTGYYTKIGNQVTAYFRFMANIDTTGMTAGNNMYVSLPFASGSEGSASGGLVLDRVTYPTGYTQVNSYVPVSVSRGTLRMSGSGVGDTDVDVEDFNGSTSDIQSFTLTYFV